MISEIKAIAVFLLICVGESVGHQCGDFYYPHPHNNYCLLCRLCPEYVVENEVLFSVFREPLCGNVTLPDGTKVQCNSHDFDKPACPVLRPTIGQLECTDNHTVDSRCRLTCPKGYISSEDQELTCLVKTQPHWSHPPPVCIVVHQESNFESKRAHKFLSDLAVCTIILLLLFCPWFLLNCSIQWNKQQQQRVHLAQQESLKSEQVVKIRLNNAKLSQRCYVLRNKWIAKKGSDIIVTADTQVSSLTQFLVMKKERKRQSDKIYSSLPSAPNEIVLHNVQAEHKGTYEWTVHLSNGTTERGDFHLDVKRSTIKESFSRNISRESGYEVLQQSEDEEFASTTSKESVGFKALLKNMKDTKRLCVLFDQNEQRGVLTWRDIATSPLIKYDQQMVNHEEYMVQFKACPHGPTFKILTTLNHQGNSVKELVDFISSQLGPTSEAVQILNKYL